MARAAKNAPFRCARAQQQRLFKCQLDIEARNLSELGKLDCTSSILLISDLRSLLRYFSFERFRVSAFRGA